MKTKTTFIMAIFSLAFIFFFMTAHAQTCTSFAPSVITPDDFVSSGGCGTYSLGAGIKHTGNDIRTTTHSEPTSPMEVSVWDKDPGFSWTDGGSIKCDMPLDANTYDPDIVLVETADDIWYALIAYADASNGDCCLNMYEWIGSGFLFHSHQVLEARAYTNSINIDADADGNFVVVWDNTSGLNFRAGISTFGAPLISPYGNNSLTGTYTFPDLSMVVDRLPDRPIGIQPPALSPGVFVTYIDSYTHFLTTIILSFDDIYLLNPLSNTCETKMVPPSGVDYLHPRIACPNTGVAVGYVVCEASSRTANDIVGFYVDCGPTPVSSNNYTDGTTSPCQINQNMNSYPVTSYDYSNSNITVAWQSDYPIPYNWSIPPQLPTGLALNCDLTGAIDASCYGINPPSYLEVEKYLHYADEAFSISGRDNASNDMFYTFYSGSIEINPFTWITDVLYKNVSPCLASYRVKNNSTTNENFDYINIIPNPVNDFVKIEFSYRNAEVIVFDLTGKVLFHSVGDETKINTLLNESIDQLSKGIYTLSVRDVDNGKEQNQKLIKM